MAVCFNGAKDLNRKSCCTGQSERKYVIASEKYLKDSIQKKNAYLKLLVMEHIQKYEGMCSY